MNEQTQPTDAELAPCPFCGTQPDECDIGQFVVECPSCAIVGPTSDNSDAARRAWNTRWGTPAGAGEVVAWLSTDSIGERYLCFTKPKDTDPARPLVFGDTTPQPTQAQAGAVPTRAFLERTLAAMEGVIDVADRNTTEFDALRSCVVDLTLMLFSDAKRQTNGASHER